jgi:hypothetical protein
MKHTRQLVAVGLLIGISLVGGCRPPTSKPDFNDEIAAASFRLQTDAKGLRECLFGGSTGELIDAIDTKENIGKLKGYAAKMRSSIKAVKSDIEDLGLPLRSPKASEVKERYLDYVKAQEELVEILDSSVALMEDENSKLSKQEKRDKIKKDFDANRDKMKKAWDDFDKVHKEFCEAHNFQPKM